MLKISGLPDKALGRLAQIDEGADFTPDFYALCPHSVGTASFLYYLALLGIPACKLIGAYQGGKKTPIRFFVPKTPVTYARGLSCDCFFDGPPLSYGDGRQKVIQLLRDPVDTITSCINAWMAVCVSADSEHGNNLLLLEDGFLRDFIRDSIFRMCMFTSMRGCVKAAGETLFIDCTDLSPAACPGTLRRVAAYIGAPYDEKVDALCTTPYNHSDYRIWFFQPPKNLNIKLDNGLVLQPGPIYVSPSKLHDFLADFSQRAHVIDVFSHNGVEYTANMHEGPYSELPDEVKAKFGTEPMRDALKKSVDIWLAHMELINRLYQQYAKTSDDIIALIKADPAFYDWFMGLMEREVSLPKKEAPELVARWKNFLSL